MDPLTGVVGHRDSTDSPEYQVIVGLEVHAQLQIPTKLFSAAATYSSSTVVANNLRQLHPFDVAVPGKLPQLSGAAVEKAVLVAAALQCEINGVSRFERKHYAYADLPFSYQVTQQRWPLAEDGLLECDWMPQVLSKMKRKKSGKADASAIQCRVERLQLEQDTGKTTTTSKTVRGEDGEEKTTTFSRVDFSRAGCALVEIVLSPDLRSSLQAASVVHAIRQLLRVTETCGGRMEEGQLRVDCNVNIEDRDGKRSPRVEVKNLNSIQQVQDAINYEARRAASLLMSKTPAQQEETRTWDVLKKKTTLIRSKDSATDYRFMPEPDLPPLVLEDVIGQLSTFLDENLVELPADARKRLQQHPYELSEYQAQILASDPVATRILEEAVQVVLDQDRDSPGISSTEAARSVAKLLCNELVALVKENGNSADIDEETDQISMSHSRVDGKQLGEIVTMLVVEETISTTMAKKLLALLFSKDRYGASPREVAKEEGFQLITDADELRQLCRAVIANHPEELAVYKRGGKFVIKMKKLFTGKSMGHSKGNAHPERLRDALDEVLDELAPGVE